MSFLHDIHSLNLWINSDSITIYKSIVDIEKIKKTSEDNAGQHQHDQINTPKQGRKRNFNKNTSFNPADFDGIEEYWK